jgi:hypothetical protein
MVPVVVFVKPVPVNTTDESNGSPTTRFGACETIAGPATVTAGVNAVPETVTGQGPAITPDAAVAVKVNVVPAAPFAAA